MITTIRITNVQEAETAMLMIDAYLTSVRGKKQEVVTPESTPKPVPVAEKPESTPKPVPVKPKAVKPKPEVEVEVEVETDNVEVTLKDLTELGKQAVATSGREVVGAVIAEFGTGKLSSVPAERYAELKAKLTELA